MKRSLLTVEEKKLLTKAAGLMEELIETVEVTDDKALVQDIEAALREAREGGTRPLRDLVMALNLESEVQA
jgi:hypothetical protein